MGFDYYTDDRLEGYELACELIRHGATSQQIAENLGVSDKCVYNWRRRIGIGTREQIETYDDPEEMERKLEKLKSYNGIYISGNYIKDKNTKEERLIKLFEEGKNATQISAELGISINTVLRWIKKAGCEQKIEKQPPHACWAAKWCKEWDDFMKSLKRPLRRKVADK